MYFADLVVKLNEEVQEDVEDPLQCLLLGRIKSSWSIFLTLSLLPQTL